MRKWIENLKERWRRSCFKAESQLYDYGIRCLAEDAMRRRGVLLVEQERAYER